MHSPVGNVTKYRMDVDTPAPTGKNTGVLQLLWNWTQFEKTSSNMAHYVGAHPQIPRYLRKKKDSSNPFESEFHFLLCVYSLLTKIIEMTSLGGTDVIRNFCVWHLSVYLFLFFAGVSRPERNTHAESLELIIRTCYAVCLCRLRGWRF